MNKLLCKLFGHRWVYSLTTYSIRYFRNCKRCGVIAEYRENIPCYGSTWFQLVQFTKKGAKDLLIKLKKEKNEK